MKNGVLGFWEQYVMFNLVSVGIVISNQFYWVKSAIEKYYRAEHTNLSNLKRLQGSEMTEDDLNIWKKSIEDNDGLKRFKTLRWASLRSPLQLDRTMSRKDLQSS